MAPTAYETVTLKTPHGHDVLAEFDHAHASIRRAKVVHNYTGVIRPLGEELAENLARALRAKQLYEQAINERMTVEETVSKFGTAAVSLGPDHPALAPYFQEARQHQSIAEDMQRHAQHFHDDVMQEIDRLIEHY